MSRRDPHISRKVRSTLRSRSLRGQSDEDGRSQRRSTAPAVPDNGTQPSPRPRPSQGWGSPRNVTRPAGRRWSSKASPRTARLRSQSQTAEELCKELASLRAELEEQQKYLQSDEADELVSLNWQLMEALATIDTTRSEIVKTEEARVAAALAADEAESTKQRAMSSSTAALDQEALTQRIASTKQEIDKTVNEEAVGVEAVSREIKEAEGALLVRDREEARLEFRLAALRQLARPPPSVYSRRARFTTFALDDTAVTRFTPEEEREPPPSSAWGMARKLQDVNGVGGVLWGTSTIKGVLCDCRLMVARHAAGRRWEEVIPIYLATTVLHCPSVWVRWDDASLQWHVLEKPQADRVEKALRAGRYQFDVPGEVFNRSVPHVSFKLAYTSPCGVQLLEGQETLVRYETVAKGDITVCPLADTVLWLPPKSEAFGKGPFAVGASPTSSVLEYIFSRPSSETLEYDAPRGQRWTARPYPNPALTWLIEHCRQAHNPLCSGGEALGKQVEAALRGTPAKVTVTVGELRGAEGIDASGLDVLLRVGSTRHRTKQLEGDQPVWDETVDFELGTGDDPGPPRAPYFVCGAGAFSGVSEETEDTTRDMERAFDRLAVSAGTRSFSCIVAHVAEGHSTQAAAEALGSLAGGAELHGMVSGGGLATHGGLVLCETNYIKGIALFGIADKGGRYASASTQTLGRLGAKAATQEALEKAGWDVSAPPPALALVAIGDGGAEKDVVQGVLDAIGHPVPVAGGISGPDCDGCTGFTRSETLRGGVLVTLMWPSGRVMARLISPLVRGNDAKVARITALRSGGGGIARINNLPAAEVYNQWANGTIAATLHLAQQRGEAAPLSGVKVGLEVNVKCGDDFDSVKRCVVIPHAVGHDGSLLVREDVQVGDICCHEGRGDDLVFGSATCMQQAVGSSPGRVHDIKGGLLFFAGECTKHLGDFALADLARSWNKAMPPTSAPVVGAFTTAQVGTLDRHPYLSSAMASVVLFSSPPTPTTRTCVPPELHATLMRKAERVAEGSIKLLPPIPQSTSLPLRLVKPSPTRPVHLSIDLKLDVVTLPCSSPMATSFYHHGIPPLYRASPTPQQVVEALDLQEVTWEQHGMSYLVAFSPQPSKGHIAVCTSHPPPLLCPQHLPLVRHSGILAGWKKEDHVCSECGLTNLHAFEEFMFSQKAAGYGGSGSRYLVCTPCAYRRIIVPLQRLASPTPIQLDAAVNETLTSPAGAVPSLRVKGDTFTASNPEVDHGEKLLLRGASGETIFWDSAQRVFLRTAGDNAAPRGRFRPQAGPPPKVVEQVDEISHGKWLAPQLSPFIASLEATLLCLGSPARSFRATAAPYSRIYSNGYMVRWTPFASSTYLPVLPATSHPSHPTPPPHPGAPFKLRAATTIPNSVTVFNIKHSRGAYVEQWSRYSRERETLFARNTCFRVEEVSEMNFGQQPCVMCTLQEVSPVDVECGIVRELLLHANTFAEARILLQVEQALLSDGILNAAYDQRDGAPVPEAFEIRLARESPRCPITTHLRGWAVAQPTSVAQMMWDTVHEGGHVTFDRAASPRKTAPRVLAGVTALTGLGSARLVVGGYEVSEGGYTVNGWAGPEESDSGWVEVLLREVAVVCGVSVKGPSAYTVAHSLDAKHWSPADNGACFSEGHATFSTPFEAVLVRVDFKEPFTPPITVSLFGIEVANAPSRCRVVSSGCTVTLYISLDTMYEEVWNATVELRRLGETTSAVGSVGAVAVAKAVSAGVRLRGILLSNNLVGEDGAAALLEAIRSNPSVTSLDISPLPPGYFCACLASALALRAEWNRVREVRHDHIAAAKPPNWPQVAALAFHDITPLELPYFVPQAGVHPSQWSEVQDEFARFGAPMPTPHPEDLVRCTGGGDIKGVSLLVLFGKASVGVWKDGRLPLHLACTVPAFNTEDGVEVLRLLVTSRGDAHRPDENGDTPLGLASRHGHHLILKMLEELQAGAGS